MLFLLAIAAAGWLWAQNLREPILGIVDGQLTPLPNKPNAVSSSSAREEQRVDPWPMKANADASIVAISEVISVQQGMTVVERTPNYLRALAVTPTMRWRDDLEFLVDESEGVVHVRSASRAGHSDMGVNRARLADLRDTYERFD